MPEVPRKNTPVSLASLWEAVKADGRTLGWGPTETALHAALAAVETGSGKYIQNNSPGNVSAGGFSTPTTERIQWRGDYWRPGWFSDESDPLHAKMLAGKAPSAFRAYASLPEGMRDWSALLMKPGYAPLRQAAQSGDVDRYVQALHDTGYSKDYSVAKHGGTFRSILRSLAAVGAPTVGDSAIVATAEKRSALPWVLGVGLGLGAVGFVLWRRWR